MDTDPPNDQTRYTYPKPLHEDLRIFSIVNVYLDLQVSLLRVNLFQNRRHHMIHVDHLDLYIIEQKQRVN